MFFRFRSGWWWILSPGKEREDLIFDPVPPVTFRWIYSAYCFTAVDWHYALWTSIIWLNLTEFLCSDLILSFLLACFFPATVPKNNIFMPSSLCQSPTGNSDSEPGKKQPFRLFLATFCSLAPFPNQPRCNGCPASNNFCPHWCSHEVTITADQNIWYLICSCGGRLWTDEISLWAELLIRMQYK